MRNFIAANLRINRKSHPKGWDFYCSGQDGLVQDIMQDYFAS